MTEQPKELFSVTLKTEKEIEHDKELQRAYQRGYEDGARSHPTPPAVEKITVEIPADRKWTLKL